MGVGKLIGKIIIIPILFIVFVCVCIFLVIRHFHGKRRDRREDKQRAQYYRQQYHQQQFMYPHQQQQQQLQQQGQGGGQWVMTTTAPPYYYFPGQENGQNGNGNGQGHGVEYTEAMMKKPEPVLYPVQQQGPHPGDVV
ncbi:hypothetical protein BO78DRAFT_398844 [Aspergillus sclerotiicarbonarius CBS 121057]|uniref:Uncharacterized protein n=1 Tax=Aspergillus sclerotiicarbonarius (strain CBS 121057 / IBT 28362) TaxID=1448318 RepID=A0A319E389_ASPSB|nr:hypothetical protein BO78DRAFT_398844 [Aspergillus sclerotiicarbonarius CBS 121057]